MRAGIDSKGVYVENGTLGDITISGLTVNVESGETGIVARNDSASLKYTNLNNNINVIGNSAEGLLHEGGNVLNSGKIIINGSGSFGIISVVGNLTNFGELNNFASVDVNGESSVGIYGVTIGSGNLKVNNNALITVADSRENAVSTGIYGKNNTVIDNNGGLEIGQNSVGIYNDGILVNHANGTINVDKLGIGFYTRGGQLQINSGTVNMENG